MRDNIPIPIPGFEGIPPVKPNKKGITCLAADTV